MNRHQAESILGLKTGYTAKDIKSAYRTLAKKHHPDISGDDKMFLLVKTAHSTLLNSTVNEGVAVYRHGSIFRVVK